jgi:hypothetical protein
MVGAIWIEVASCAVSHPAPASGTVGSANGTRRCTTRIIAPAHGRASNWRASRRLTLPVAGEEGSGERDEIWETSLTGTSMSRRFPAVARWRGHV